MTLLLLTPAYADDPVDLGRLLISPRRMGVALAIDETVFAGNSTIVLSDEIPTSGATTVQGILKRLEGVTLADTNGFGTGSDTTVNLRGVVNSSRSNVLVLVDGVRQNRLTGDEVHWQSIPIAQIERIEILRGGAGTIYGEGALAGVISITTKQQAEKPIEGSVHTEIGSYGHQRHNVSVRGRLDPVQYSVNVERRLLDGYRNNTNARATTVSGHVGIDLGERWHLNLRALHSEDTTRFPGGITRDMVEQNRRSHGAFTSLFDDETDQVSMELAGELGFGFRTTLTGYWRQRVADSVEGFRFTTRTPSKGVGLRVSHAADLGGIGHTLIWGMELNDDKATTGTRGGTTRMSESNRTAFGLYVQETLQFGDAVTVVGGYRFDKSRYHEDLTFPDFMGTLRFEGSSPHVGVTWNPHTSIDLYASYARVFKAPNIDDLDAVDNLFRDNTDLEPQLADHYEVGVRLRPQRWWPLETELTYFQLRIDDEILFDPENFRNENFDTKRRGFEVSLRGSWWDDRLHMYSNYAYVHAGFRQGALTGYRLPLTPEHHFKMGGTLEVFPQFTVGMDWQLVNRQFRVNDIRNQFPADNYGVARLTLQYAWRNATAYLNFENLTNEEYSTFQASSGSAVTTGENPAPPFRVVGGVRVTF